MNNQIYYNSIVTLLHCKIHIAKNGGQPNSANRVVQKIEQGKCHSQCQAPFISATAKQTKPPSCTNANWEQWPLLNVHTPNGFPSKGIIINVDWSNDLNNINRVTNGSLSPSELQAHFKDDKITEELVRKFREEIAHMETEWKGKRPTVLPKK